MGKTYSAVLTDERQLEIAVARATRDAFKGAVRDAVAEARANAIARRLGIIRRHGVVR